jgi:hypothetical protein
VKGGQVRRYPTKSDDVYVFSRSRDDSDVLVMVNLGRKAEKLEYKADAPAVGKVNYFTGQAEDHATSLRPGEYRVYVNR